VKKVTCFFEQHLLVLEEVTLLSAHGPGVEAEDICVFEDLPTLDNLLHRNIEELKLHLHIVLEMMKLLHFGVDHRHKVLRQLLTFAMIVVPLVVE